MNKTPKTKIANMHKILGCVVIFSASTSGVLAADYTHCSTPQQHNLAELSRANDNITATFSKAALPGTNDSKAAHWIPDLSTIVHAIDLELPLNNAETVTVVFQTTDETSIRAELLPDNPGPHGELQLALSALGGPVFFLDFNNGLYHDPSWATEREREVPRLDLRLATGVYALTACNSYVADTGRLILGRQAHGESTRRTQNPFASDNDL